LLEVEEDDARSDTNGRFCFVSTQLLEFSVVPINLFLTFVAVGEIGLGETTLPFGFMPSARRSSQPQRRRLLR
jgi:hypothetical protein